MPSTMLVALLLAAPGPRVFAQLPTAQELNTRIDREGPGNLFDFEDPEWRALLRVREKSLASKRDACLHELRSGRKRYLSEVAQ